MRRRTPTRPGLRHGPDATSASRTTPRTPKRRQACVEADPPGSVPGEYASGQSELVVTQRSSEHDYARSNRASPTIAGGQVNILFAGYHAPLAQLAAAIRSYRMGPRFDPEGVHKRDHAHAGWFPSRSGVRVPDAIGSIPAAERRNAVCTMALWGSLAVPASLSRRSIAGSNPVRVARASEASDARGVL